jgi:hypothetical protein
MPFDPFDFERADLRARLAALSLEVKLLRLAHALRGVRWDRKDDDDEDEGPDDDDGPKSPHLQNLAQQVSDQSGPPKIPDNRPPTSALRTEALKLAARELGRAIEDGRADTFLKELLERADWLRERAAQIMSYIDGPKPLEELTRLANEPAPGYQIHHIVEQTSAAQDGYTLAQIESPSNLVRVPTLKHYELNAMYSEQSPEFNDM